MPGLSVYSATNFLNAINGKVVFPAVSEGYLAIFTAATGDVGGTGWTEVAGMNYARVGIPAANWNSPSGTNPTTMLNAATVTFPTAANLSVPNTPSLTANTTGGSLATGTVYVKVTYVSAGGETTPSAEASVSVTGPTGQVVVTSPSALAGAVGYNIYASTATGTETKQNSAAIAIGTNYNINSIATGAATPSVNTASWGNIVAWAWMDAITAGNALFGDWLGQDPWFAFTGTNASPGIITAPGITAGSTPNLVNGAQVVLTNRYSSNTLPGGINDSTLYPVSGLSNDTFNVGVNTSSVGGGLCRQVGLQPVVNNQVLSFNASTITLAVST